MNLLRGMDDFRFMAERTGNLAPCCRIPVAPSRLTKEKEAAALDGVGTGAREVRGGRDAAEEDEPIPEGAENTVFGCDAHCRLQGPHHGGPVSWSDEKPFRNRKNSRDRSLHWLELGPGAGFGAAFFAGEEMPKLIRKKRKPLRRESTRLMELPFRGHLQSIARKGDAA